MAVAVEHDPTSAALVRKLVDEDLGALAVSRSSIDDVVLVASELIGNAVVHTEVGGEPIDLGWSVDATSVTFWVADLSEGQPEVGISDSRATSGRGMAIVAAVSLDWGVERLRHGKRVWARVPVTFSAA